MKKVKHNPQKSSNSPKNYHLAQDLKNPLFEDLLWSTPEQKLGRLLIIGGHAASLAPTLKIATLATQKPLRSIHTLLPDAAQKLLPKDLENLIFAPSTPSGSLAPSSQLAAAIATADATLIFGDLSKNSATAIALATALQASSHSSAPQSQALNSHASLTTHSHLTPPTPHPPKPLLITRDAIDLLAPDAATLLAHPNLILLLSLAQLQKLFRAIFYPKMLLFSSPLPATIDILHKFTLSYPVTLATFHQTSLLTAKHGIVITTPLSATPYTPLTLWSGPLALEIITQNLWHPTLPLDATTAALLA